MDEKTLEKARIKREKEVRLNNIIRELVVYSLYLWILVIISYGQRDPNGYYMRLNIINNFIKPGDHWNDFNKVNTDRRFWNWTTEVLIPELLIGNWYNNRIPLGLRGFIDDRNNVKISYAIMRQVRIKTSK
ncbi:polycystic kidney disease protein 1-like 2 [Centruroides sculpturatus]|uniref:polycystic kidney disease protein 1-like 2 n=1 Tax=Centruroides sculpturatus TaxID=218467 RepID=UPI000C6D0B0C|nr:polycystic kidney disease protein 1-like 2 [Centruroides sculpturatus]